MSASPALTSSIESSLKVRCSEGLSLADLGAGGRKSSLQVVAWPYRGKPGKISVFRDSPSASTWVIPLHQACYISILQVRAQITFRHIDNFFLVMFRAGGPATKGDSLHLALDQVLPDVRRSDPALRPGEGAAGQVPGLRGRQEAKYKVNICYIDEIHSCFNVEFRHVFPLFPHYPQWKG